jgi:hypothetical protein
LLGKRCGFVKVAQGWSLRRDSGSSLSLMNDTGMEPFGRSKIRIQGANGGPGILAPRVLVLLPTLVELRWKQPTSPEPHFGSRFATTIGIQHEALARLFASIQLTNDALFHVPGRLILQQAVTCIRHNVTLDERGLVTCLHPKRGCY